MRNLCKKQGKKCTFKKAKCIKKATPYYQGR